MWPAYDRARGNDHNDLSGIDAMAGGADDAFSFIGSGGVTHVAGQLRAYADGGSTVIEGDVNEDGVADLRLTLTGTYSLLSGGLVL